MSKTEMPSIRFCGFDNTWEQRKLSELIIEYKKTVGSDCTLPILTSSKTEGVILQEDHFGRKQNHDITGYNILPRNYCTYRNRSDGVDFTFNINRCCDKGIISKFYPVFYGNNCDIFFISLVLNNSNEVVREIGYTCTGTGQKVLSFLDLQKMKIRVPKYEEQKRIASYIETLDNLITLHQRKYEKLQAFKASMLEKMFPKDGADVPEVRFKGFIDAWEQRVLGSLCDKFTDGDWIESKDQSNSGVRLIQTGNIGVAEYLDKPSNKKWVSEDTFNRLHCEEVLPGDILISRLPDPAGRACIIPFLGTKMITAVDCTIVRVASDISNLFLVQYLSSQSYFNEVINCLAGGTRQRISRNNLANFSIPIPKDRAEQDAIGEYFRHLDHLIILHQYELGKLQNIKKALLEKMFV